MELLLVCKYCNEKWQSTSDLLKANGFLRCHVCGDENVDVKELSKYKIDQYVGCPKFEDKKDEDGVPDLLKWFSGD